MKKRVGSKLYDTDNGILILQDTGITGLNLYKQPKNRSFYLFDGDQITPLELDEAADLIRRAGDPALLKYLEVTPDVRGCTRVGITIDHYNKLSRIAAARGVSMKSIIESYIDSLPEA